LSGRSRDKRTALPKSSHYHSIGEGIALEIKLLKASTKRKVEKRDMDSPDRPLSESTS